MKKKLLALLCAMVLLGTALTGCSAASGGTAADGAVENTVADRGAFGDSDARLTPQTAETGELSANSGGAKPEDASRTDTAKRIYTAQLELETTAFNDTAESLEKLVAACGGYFEASSVSSYGDGYRCGWYTVRVPSEQFASFCAQAGALSHLLSRSSAAEDVSEAYYDTAGRLKTQQIKLERLQELLSRADKMEDIIALESAISQTEEQIDTLSGTLRRYDAQVDYSAVSISLNEVYRLSNTEEPASGFLSRFKTALSSGARGFVSFLQGVAVALAYGWVWVVLAVVAAVGIRRGQKRRRARIAEKKPVPTPHDKPNEL